MGMMGDFAKFMRRFGIDISRYPPPSHHGSRTRRLIDAYHVDTVLDIGANSGQFAGYMRETVGYKGRIISFEPQSAAFAELKKNAADDPNWEVHNIALGETEGPAEINIAGNSFSSSLLSMHSVHLAAAPESAFIGKETVTVRRLDTIFDELCGRARRVYLKSDTQGYEIRVLNGAAGVLERIDFIQIEMVLVPLYEGELPYSGASRRPGGAGL